MDKNRMWIIGSVLLMAIVVGLGWFLGIAPQLANAAASDAQRAGVDATNLQTEATLAQLKKDYANLGQLNSTLADLAESVPGDTAIPALVDEVDAIGASTGVTIAGFAVADAKPYVPVSPPAVAASAPTSTATPAPTATPSAAATPAPAPAPVAGMPPVTSSKLTAANFSSLTVTLTVHGTYPQILSFVDGVQTGKRLFLVTGITTSSQGSSTGAAAHSGQETGTITGLIFVVTQPAQPAQPAQPGSTSTPTPTPTPSK